MGDENGGFEVVPDALREEAQRWRAISGQMNAAYQTVLRLGLSRDAFSAGRSSAPASSEVLAEHYKLLLERMVDMTAAARTEFEEIGGALDRASEAYLRTDLDAKEMIDVIYGGPPQ